MNIPGTLLHQRESTPGIENKSNTIATVTWATLVLSVVVLLARQCIKLALGQRKAGIDDLFILAAAVFAIGLSVTILILASDGLGGSGLLTVKRAEAIQKGIYASDFLYISTLCFAKLSLLYFFYDVYHKQIQRRVVLSIGIFTLVWTLASLATVAFQCGLPKPWEVFTLHCFNTGVFWIVYCIIDMTSEVVIIMLSVNLVAYLKVRLSRKLAVVACFAPRILVIGAAVVRLLSLYPISPHDNPAFKLWIPIICTQAQASVSIFTACIPYVRPFFETAESSIRRMSQARNKRLIIDEESTYGCCSVGYFRGYKRARDHSAGSTEFMVSRTTEVSPRIPSPRPLSPLMPPNFNSPPNASSNRSRSPSERGLRLLIPDADETRRATDLLTPQTASSQALSPRYLSPNQSSNPSWIYPADGTKPRSVTVPPSNEAPSLNRQQRPRRFSLFPSPQQQQHPPLPQMRARPQFPPLTTITERPRSHTVAHVHHAPTSQTPETRTPSPNVPLPIPPPPSIISLRPSSSLERVAYDDPLRTVPMAVTTSAAVPAPVLAAHNPHTSIPSYYVQTPPTAETSAFSSPQPVPSYYVATPPAAHPPRFQQSNPYAYAVPPPPVIPTSPRFQRNQRILTPQNSSRRDQMSPISPVTPSTPSGFWHDDGFGGATTPRTPGGWEQAQLMPVVRDVRFSPRIVEQRYS